MHDLITTAKAQVAAKKNDEGFTLIELLVVIAVIGILSAIVVFGVANFRGDATAAACTAAKTTVTTAAEAYWAQHGGSTVSIATLQDPANNYLKAGYSYPGGSCAVPAGVTLT
jgi:prepilin-type N-terminal cleavage/methylation domain-containing protein